MHKGKKDSKYDDKYNLSYYCISAVSLYNLSTYLTVYKCTNFMKTKA